MTAILTATRGNITTTRFSMGTAPRLLFIEFASGAARKKSGLFQMPGVTNMIPEFKTKPGIEYAIAKTGGFDLLISAKRWILRIGAQQWTGEAQNIDHAQKLVLNFMADQIREPAMFLARMKKEGEI